MATKTSAAGVILYPGHWILEENPDAATRMVVEFLFKQR